MARLGSVAIDAKDWKLSETVAKTRRAQLLCGPSFERIVSRIAREMKLIALSRQEAREKPTFFRAIVILQVEASTVDLFHNSARGYRAQYYSSVNAGERANFYAVQALAPRIVELSKAFAKGTCAPDWLARSVADPNGKVWIHQGLWLRHAKLSDAVLFVSRWLRHQKSADAKRRKRAFWASLAPHLECRIQIKGAYFRNDGKPLGTLKPDRASELHNLGFT